MNCMKYGKIIYKKYENDSIAITFKIKILHLTNIKIQSILTLVIVLQE